MREELERSFSFTPRAEREMLNTVEDLSFPGQEPEMIFQALRRRLRYVPFCDYLKRYIYLTAGISTPFHDVPLSEYQVTLVDAFRDTGTPSSFRRSGSHLATRARAWLTQGTIQRQAMLLLGFGLSMSREEVDRFLTRACHDRKLDPEDPLDAICAYCYEHRYGFSKMEQLLDIYRRASPGEDLLPLLHEAHPSGRAESRKVAEEDALLIRRLLPRKGNSASTTLQQRTWDIFFSLHRKAQAIIQDFYPEEFATPEEVAPYGFEMMLCAPIPRTGHGNLVSHLSGNLQKEMSAHRFSRQHLHQLLKGTLEPARYDLIILSFLVCAEGDAASPVPQERYRRFISGTDAMLAECGFGPLYAADPWECFLLMCMLAEDPLDAYSTVNEMAYDAKPGKERRDD